MLFAWVFQLSRFVQFAVILPLTGSSSAGKQGLIRYSRLIGSDYNSIHFNLPLFTFCPLLDGHTLRTNQSVNSRQSGIARKHQRSRRRDLRQSDSRHSKTAIGSLTVCKRLYTRGEWWLSIPYASFPLRHAHSAAPRRRRKSATTTRARLPPLSTHSRPPS